ncbi:MAG: hypothetical protein H0X53_04940, partial [Sphingomonas sp.]|nr:hypothetical protein [Sphingomonas sp.]
TPLVTATGAARGNSAFRFPADLANALKSGFELAANDEPVIEQAGSEDSFALVAPAQIIPAAPAPFDNVREQVELDWLRQEGSRQAQALANAIAAAARGNTTLAEAVRNANAPAGLPPIETARARRIQLTELGENVPAPLRVLFSVPQGRTQVGADPQGRGFFVVKVNRIIPGNALNQPQLIAQVQTEFSEPLAQEYAQQFLAALKKSVGVERNESAIEATKQRITGGGN